MSDLVNCCNIYGNIAVRDDLMAVMYRILKPAKTTGKCVLEKQTLAFKIYSLSFLDVLSQSVCLSKQVFYLGSTCLCSWSLRGMLNIKWKVKYKGRTEVFMYKILRLAFSTRLPHIDSTI